MDVVAQFGNTIAIVIIGVLVWFYLRGRFEQIDRRFDRVEQDISDLRADIDRKFEFLVAEINRVRSDLTQIALAVDARSRPEANPA
jgi:hypothetical protein